MTATARQLMWDYQPHFRACALRDAERVLALLDADLEPEVVLVGFTQAAGPDRPEICVEPPEPPIDMSLLEQVPDRAEQLSAEDPERDLLLPHPAAHRSHRETVRLRALRNALLTSLNEQADRTDRAWWVSWPVQVRGYRVSLAVGLRRAALAGHHRLRKSRVEHWRVPVSLIDATVKELLDVVCDRLNQLDPGGALWVLRRDPEEVLRAAGHQLMHTVAYAGGNYDGRHSVFAACNRLAALRYEGIESTGRLLVARADHPNVRTDLRFSRSVPLDDHRAVRKFLQLTGGELGLLTDSQKVIGLGRLTGTYDASREDLMTIRFLGHYTWELCHAGRVLMRVKHGQPRLPRPPMSEAKLRQDLPRIFDGLSDEQIDRIARLAMTAATGGHGTILVISAAAASEARRLAGQGTCVEPILLTPEVLRLAAAIDGAVLLDPAGTCHAIGVILDGVATDGGDRSRGARYNSAVRYVASRVEPCLAVVVSDDGYVNLVPDLRPRVRASEIQAAVERLERIADDDAMDPTGFHEVMDWLEAHAFYLGPTVCRRVNELHRAIERHWDAQPNPPMRMGYPDFHPAAEMNDSYLLFDA